MDIDAGTNVAKEITIRSVSRNSGIIDPTIHAIVSAQPVLHSKVRSIVKVTDISLQAGGNIVAMDSFYPAASDLLSHLTASESQPGPIEPQAILVFARYPNHDRGRIHDLAESRIQTTEQID